MIGQIGVITINDNNNYGNRLQNYAVQEVLKKHGYEAITIKNIPQLNNKYKIPLRFIKYILKKIIKKKDSERLKKFREFNKNIKFSKNYITANTKIATKYKYFFVR